MALHRVDNRRLRPLMKAYGQQACHDLRPMTLVTPFRVTLGHKAFFPARQSFRFDPSLDEVYLVYTDELNAREKELEEPE